MPALKRQASESFLPSRVPKQARHVYKDAHGNKSSPSFGGIWKGVATKIKDGFCDTTAIFLSRMMHSDPGYESDGGDSTPSSSGLTQDSSPELTASSSPPRTPIDDISPALGHLTIRNGSSPNRGPLGERLPEDNLPTPPPEPLTSTPRLSKTKSPHGPSSSSIATPAHEDLSTPEPSTPKAAPLSLPDPSPKRSSDLATVPSSSRDSSSIGVARASTSTSVVSSQQSAMSRRSTHFSLNFADQSIRSMSQTKGRDPRRRKHVLHDAHIAATKRYLRETAEEYAEKVKQGYSSNFADFQGLKKYRTRLLSLHKSLGQTLGPSRSLQSKQRAASPGPQPEFLQKRLDYARSTLESPKPVTFTPSLDLLDVKRRARGADLEARLRPPVLPLPSSLPPADETYVDGILRKLGPISSFDRQSVSSDDIERLRPGKWLNDEIINFYGTLISARGDAAANGHQSGKDQYLKVHYFSTFFWTKLYKDGYEKGRLAKWTKKFDLFSKDIILIPVNHGNAHWTAATINFKKKRIESYDSMQMENQVVFQCLRQYIDAEHRSKKNTPFDFTGWQNWAPDWTPQQENGYDCGVFTCQFLETASRGVDVFNFSQRDMPYLRRRMIWEIAQTKLRTEH